jgi:hypothetical protein
VSLAAAFVHLCGSNPPPPSPLSATVAIALAAAAGRPHPDPMKAAERRGLAGEAATTFRAAGPGRSQASRVAQQPALAVRVAPRRAVSGPAATRCRRCSPSEPPAGGGGLRHQPGPLRAHNDGPGPQSRPAGVGNPRRGGRRGRGAAGDGDDGAAALAAGRAPGRGEGRGGAPCRCCRRAGPAWTGGEVAGLRPGAPVFD